MADDPRNKIYRFSWTEPSGFDYRLDIKPSGADYLDSPEIIEEILGNDIITDYEYQWEYEKYRLGIRSHTGSFTFSLDKLTNANLISYLSNPLTTQTIVVNDSYSQELITGNIFELYIKFNGLFTDVNKDYLQVYKGIQQNGLEDGYDSDTYEFTVQTESIFTSVAQAMDLERFFATEMAIKNVIYGDPPKRSPFYINAYNYLEDIAGSGWKHLRLYAANPKGRNTVKMEFLRLDLFFGQLELYFEKLYKAFVREDVSCELNFLTPKCYKQAWQGTSSPYYNNIRGDLLNTNQIYVMTKVNEDGKDSVDGIFTKFPNDFKTFWDFLEDYSVSTLSYCVFDPILHTLNSYPLLNTTSITVNTPDIETLNIQPRSRIMQKVSAESLERKAENTDKLVLVNQVSRNKEQFNLPVIFYNFGVVYDPKGSYPYGLWHGERGDVHEWCGWKLPDTDVQLRIHAIEDILACNLFYFDSIESSPEVPIRIDERCQFDIGDGTMTDDVVTVPNIPWKNFWFIANSEADNYFFNRIQTESGMLFIAGKTLQHVFGGTKQTLIKGKCPLEVGVSLTYDGNDFTGTLPWFWPVEPIYLDLNEFCPSNASTMYNGFPTKFYVYKVEIKKDDDTDSMAVEFEALGV